MDGVDELEPSIVIDRGAELDCLPFCCCSLSAGCRLDEKGHLLIGWRAGISCCVYQMGQDVFTLNHFAIQTPWYLCWQGKWKISMDVPYTSWQIMHSSCTTNRQLQMSKYLDFEQMPFVYMDQMGPSTISPGL